MIAALLLAAAAAGGFPAADRPVACSPGIVSASSTSTRAWGASAAARLAPAMPPPAIATS